MSLDTGYLTAGLLGGVAGGLIVATLMKRCVDYLQSKSQCVALHCLSFPPNPSLLRTTLLSRLRSSSFKAPLLSPVMVPPRFSSFKVLRLTPFWCHCGFRQEKITTRLRTEAQRSSGIVIHDGVVHISGQVGNIPDLETSDITAQTNQTLAKIDTMLAEVRLSVAAALRIVHPRQSTAHGLGVAIFANDEAQPNPKKAPRCIEPRCILLWCEGHAALRISS